MSAARRQNTSCMPVCGAIRAPGTIQVDERLVSLVTLRFEGFVDAVENVTTGDRSAPTKLTFAKTGTTLLSTSALPAGKDLPAVVQIKSTPTSPTITAKFTLDLSKCGECKLAEYACICAH